MRLLSPTDEAIIRDLFPGSQGYSINQLRDAWAAIAAKVAEFAPALARVELTAVGIAAAGPKAAAAYLALPEQDRRHRAIRHAQALMRTPSVRQQDPDMWESPYAVGPGSEIPNRMGTFFDQRGFPEVMSNAWTLTRTTGTLPGPQEPIARLLWLATDAAEDAWVPTPEEQDERWAEFQRAMQASMDARRRAGFRGLVHRIRPDAIEIADRVGGAGGVAEQMAKGTRGVG